jgi:hypothetical protein
VSSVGASNATVVVDGTPSAPTLRVGDLSATYLKLASGTSSVAGLPIFTGGIRSDDGSGNALVITDAMQGTRAGMINWASTVSGVGQHLIHLTTAAGFGGTSLIGMAPDGGGNCLFSDNKGTAATSACVKIVNEITNNVYSDAYGLFGQQASTTSPLFFIESIFGGSAPLVRLKGTSWGTGQILADHMLSDGTTISWRTFAQDGRQEFLAKTRFSNFAHQNNANSPNAGLFIETNRAAGANTEMRFYRWTGGTNQYYPFRITAGGGAGNELTIQSGALSSTVDGTETLASPVIRIGNNTNFPTIGFYNTAPAVQASRAGQLTDSTGGTVSSTLAAGITDSVAKNAIASLAAKLNALETIIHTVGLSA